VRIEGEQRGVRVRALLSAPEDSRSGAVGLHIFVNGRPVRERQLARSVAYAYGSVLPPGRYPTGVVHLELDPAEVDVNVHPQKAEVRFQRGREVNEAVTRVLAQGLGTSAWSGPSARGNQFWSERLPVGPNAAPPAPKATLEQVPADDPWGLSYPMPAPQSYELPPAAPVPQARDSLMPEAPRLRALAQVRKLYIVAEGERGLVVLDQHAADERVQYDRLRKQFLERAVVLQRLLLPERVIVSEREAALIDAHGEELARAGVEVALIGADAAAISAVPAILRRAAPERLLRDLLDELTRSGERNFGDAIDMALATMACHGAIRAGDALSLEECQALLDASARIGEFAGHCPHGRPVLMELPFQELAKRVGR
jgi:DNA mismatch repair protein MutL